MKMTKKRVLLEDGRNLIYYTFEKSSEKNSSASKEPAAAHKTGGSKQCRS